MASVYGIPDPTPEEIEIKEKEVYNYLKALIEAELINPEHDYDGERQTALLKKIAIYPLSAHRRTELVALLTNNENSED